MLGNKNFKIEYRIGDNTIPIVNTASVLGMMHDPAPVVGSFGMGP